MEAQLTDERVKPVAIHIMVDINLLSRVDLLDRFSNLRASEQSENLHVIY